MNFKFGDVSETRCGLGFRGQRNLPFLAARLLGFGNLCERQSINASRDCMYDKARI